ncbi:MAG: hypothetical protein AAFV80_22210, partial [Bacteroidota bacterium]
LVLEHPINVKDELGVDLFTDRTTLFPLFTINGAFFDNVLVNSWDVIEAESNLEVYFQQGIGIVGFNDMANDAVYVFDRVE